MMFLSELLDLTLLDILNSNLFGAVQKLRKGQRREGVSHFVTYRYVYFEGEGVFYEIVT